MTDDHGHDHASRAARVASELRARALEALLVERGLVSTDAIDAVVEYYENDVGPQNGARVIARAWVDPDYRTRLLSDGSARDRRARLRRRRGRAHGRRREHAGRAQRDRLHALLLLPLARARAAAHLVQERGLSRARRRRAAAGARASSGSSWIPTSTCASGTRAPRCATSCCPSGPRARTALSEEQLAALVTRDAMIGVRASRRRREHVAAEVDAQLSDYAPLPRANGELSSTRSGTVARSAWASSCSSGSGCPGARSATTSSPRSSATAARGRDGRRGLLRRVPGRDRVAGGRPA